MLNICHVFTVAYNLGEGKCEHGTKNHEIHTELESIEAGETHGPGKKLEDISPRR